MAVCVCVMERSVVHRGGLVHHVVLSKYLITLQEKRYGDNCLTMWKKNLISTNKDRRQPTSGEWLTANHISAAYLLLKHAFPEQNGLCDTCRNNCGSLRAKTLLK